MPVSRITKKNGRKLGGGVKKTKKQHGGAVASMDDFTYDDIALSKNVKINWGWLPGPPPTDCSIM
jgi:hypothetical protein